MVDDLRRTAFVVMPYGRKREPNSRREIDFDDIWVSAYRPAAEDVGIEPVRADEERLGGFVHLAMFERLLLAEVVLADLTLASPNVMYELGIRHASRPRATIAAYAQVGALPFDLSPIRAVPYQLDKRGRLTDDAREHLRAAITERFRQCLEDTASDSPLFQLIRNYPGVVLSHEATESFQQRVQTLLQLSTEIRDLPSRLPSAEALPALRAAAERVMLLGNDTPPDLLVDLLLSYRDVSAWQEMVDLCATLPPLLREHPTVRQQLALALNRRRGAGDVRRAVRILEELIAEERDTPETLGILGRIYKDEYLSLRENHPEQAHAALVEAISTYERGFEADSRDYYPGINAVTLLVVEGSPASRRRAQELSPVVAFAVGVRGGLGSHDHWDLATVLELAVARADEAQAREALHALLRREPPGWVRETIAANLWMLLEAHEREGPMPWLHAVVRSLGAPLGG